MISYRINGGKQLHIFDKKGQVPQVNEGQNIIIEINYQEKRLNFMIDKEVVV